MRRRIELLAIRTEMTRSLPNDEVLEWSTASQARFAATTTAIDLQSKLVAAGPTSTVSIAGEGCTAMLDGRPQHRPDRAMERANLIWRKRTSRSQWMDAGHKQCLVGVDVPDAGDD